MTDTPAFLSERLMTEGEKTLAFFQALTPHEWESVVYTEGAEWTIRAMLAHLVTAERGFIKLFREINEGGPGARDDFDIDRFNASQQEKTKALAPQELMEQFRDGRASMSDWVATLTPADLEKTGRHPFLGHTSLSEMIKMVYRHNQLHQRDLRRMRNPGG